ncbi:MAG: FAD-binding oxidoreductase, partial [Chloroflexota bacterium]|nr:FAD-binding oxidoreductase [Chloroflexota bacterium]
HYSNIPETKLAFESLKYFENWSDMVGGDCGFHQVGTLVFASREHRDHLEANLAIQREVGVNSCLIAVDEAREIDPDVYTDDVDVVGYEPESGYADPNATTYAFADAARAMGVEIRQGARALRVLTDGTRVTDVETDRGAIRTRRVIVVAGAWANQLFEPIGVDLGLFPRQSRIAIFRGAQGRTYPHPTYIDHANHLWARPIDGNCTLGGAEIGAPVRVDPEDYQEHVTQEYIEFTRKQLGKRFPSIAQSTVRGNWACALMGSPDGRPVIGTIEQYDGLHTMAGDNGTSFKTAPAIGKCLSELVLEGDATTVDLTPFRPSRFAEGQPWVDRHDYQLVDASVSR